MRSRVDSNIAGLKHRQSSMGGKVEDGGPNKGKINIFDTTDMTNLRKEALERIGYDNSALVPLSQRQVAPTGQHSKMNRRANSAMGFAMERYKKPSTLDYIERSKRESKESVKDFI